MIGPRFDAIAEVEPATRPDLTKACQQVGVLAPVASRFLIPDDRIGRATVSSVAVARVRAALDLVATIRASGAFDAVHLIPVARYRDLARRLEER